MESWKPHPKGWGGCHTVPSWWIYIFLWMKNAKEIDF